MANKQFQSFARCISTRIFVVLEVLIMRSNCPTTISAYMNKSLHCLVKLQIHFPLAFLLDPLLLSLENKNKNWKRIPNSVSFCKIGNVGFFQNKKKQKQKLNGESIYIVFSDHVFQELPFQYWMALFHYFPTFSGRHRFKVLLDHAVANEAEPRCIAEQCELEYINYILCVEQTIF